MPIELLARKLQVAQGTLANIQNRLGDSLRYLKNFYDPQSGLLMVTLEIRDELEYFLALHTIQRIVHIAQLHIRQENGTMVLEITINLYGEA